MISRKALFFESLLLCISTCFHVGNSGRHRLCSDVEYNVNSTDGRAYRSNLETLLATLLSNATTPDGFSSSTAGTANATAYGLFLCRGDVSPGDCQTCLTNATTEAFTTEVCSNKTRADIFYTQCMLRFSDQPLLSRVDASRWRYTKKESNFTDGEVNQVLGDTFEAIATKAAAGTAKKFAVREGRSSFSKIYALGQCTPDLSNEDCDYCVRRAISHLPGCCSNSRGVTVLYPSCNIRYEAYSFFHDPAPAPPPMLPDSGTGSNKGDGGGISMTTIVAIIIPIVVGILLFVATIIFCKTKRGRKRREPEAIHKITDTGVSSISTDAESLRYNFSQVQAYTENFAAENLIGQGGFGPVYKATLPDGRIVAVKRLSGSSTQGAKEFINEIVLLAKLQHRNLVRLLGYCLEREEKILIYEFVVNKSLDYFLFDLDKQSLLDWLVRYKIIGGIARGMLYLHEDSRIKIIHRDLKAGNVLLDQNMNPKIADFGMARLFENDHSEENTSRIAGTFGYMAPEYAFHGMLSVKLDVFSFGVLVLEIISGKKNNNFQNFGDDDLLSYTWKQWRNGTPLAVMDKSMENSYNQNEVVRCIHIGLLCVEEHVERRPTMASVVLMLNSPSATLRAPNPPSYYGRSTTERFPTKIGNVTESNELLLMPENSRNEVSFTELSPR